MELFIKFEEKFDELECEWLKWIVEIDLEMEVVKFCVIGNGS